MNPSTFHRIPNPGLVRISGADRIDFIQRQSTNDLRGMGPDLAVRTVLTNPSARIIDVLQIVSGDENSLDAYTLPGRGADTAFFLKKRVFFMDKVSIANESEAVFIVDVDGQDAARITGGFGVAAPALDRTATADFAGQTLRLIGQPGLFGQGIRIVGPPAAAGAVMSALGEGGAVELDAAEYEKLRVSLGLPGPAEELTEAYTPLEVGLDDLISDVKGCYTGQEVIARQITYDKITRRLAGIRLDGPASVGSRVVIEGSNAGTITSYTISPRFGPIGLAVLKRPYFEPGTAVQVVNGEQPIEAIVVDTPFQG